MMRAVKLLKKSFFELGQAIFKKLQKFQHIQEVATDYAKKGLIPKESADRYVNMAWKFVQKWAKKIK